MKKSAKRQIAEAAMWTAYLVAMGELRASALALVDVLAAYLRAGDNCAAFYAAHHATIRYTMAASAAAPFHFATLPGAPDLVNHSASEIANIMRDIRGREVLDPVRFVDSNGIERVRARIVHVDGVAQWVDQEIASMTRYGSPRRRPAEAA